MTDKTPWAVWCYGLMKEVPSCGQQFLTKDEYSRQLSRADQGWECPLCGADAEWDDSNYEEAMELLEVEGK